MASDIDRVGCFRGNIVEHGVGASSGGYPQFVARFQATQKYVEDKDEMAAFELTEPGWVDWTAYEQQATGYFVLFGKDKANPGALKPLFHIDALQRALGWDGASFASLGGTDWSKKVVTFWMEENEYQGNTTIRPSAIDEENASPNRSLRVLDTAGMKDLDAKFAGMLKTAAPVAAAKAPAKPPVSGGKPPAGKGVPPKSAPAATNPSPTPALQSPATTPAAVAPSVPASPSKGPPKTGGGMTQEQAWDHVSKNKGAAVSDDTQAEKWIDASTALYPGKDETTMTNAEWAAVALKTLELIKS